MDESKTSKPFRQWRRRLGLTQQAAAKALGIARNSVANYDLGKRSDKPEPVEVPKIVLLACAAVEKGLPPII